MWNFTKPPIHGIAALHGMMDAFTPAELAEAYEKMQRQTDYWLAYMDSDHDGIPQYNHGNDCGWDNCTPFRVGPPVEGPDLCAYIILQLYALEQMAVRLGRSERDWRAEASELLRRLLSHSYDERLSTFINPARTGNSPAAIRCTRSCPWFWGVISRPKFSLI